MSTRLIALLLFIAGFALFLAGDARASSIWKDRAEEQRIQNASELRGVDRYYADAKLQQQCLLEFMDWSEAYLIERVDLEFIEDVRVLCYFEERSGIDKALAP